MFSLKTVFVMIAINVDPGEMLHYEMPHLGVASLEMVKCFLF